MKIIIPLRINKKIVYLSLIMITVLCGIFIMIIGAYDRNTLPIAYFLGFYVLSICFILSLKSRNLSLCILFLMGVSIQFFLIYGVEKILWLDGVRDTLLARIFQENTLINPFPTSTYTGTNILSTLSFYSGFPALDSIGIVLSEVTGLSLTIIGFFFSILLLIGSTILIEQISNIIFKNNNISIFSALLFILWSEQSFWFSQFTKQTMGFFLFIFMIYLLVLLYTKPHNRIYWICLFIICTITLPITHYFTAAIMILFLFLIMVYDIFKKHIFKLDEKQKSLAPFSILILFIITLFIFTYYSNTFIIGINGIITTQIQIFIGEISLKNINPTIMYLPVSPPIYAMVIPIIRDIILAIIVIGGFFLVRREKRDSTILSLINILLVVSIILLILGITGIGRELSRLLLFVSIPGAILGGYFIYKLLNYNRKICKCLIVLFLILTPFSLWAHTVAPLNVYGLQTSQDFYASYPLISDKENNAMNWLFDNSIPTNTTYYSGINLMSETDNNITIENFGTNNGIISWWANNTTYKNLQYTYEVNRTINGHMPITIFIVVEDKETYISADQKAVIPSEYINEIYDNGDIKILTYG